MPSTGRSGLATGRSFLATRRSFLAAALAAAAGCSTGPADAGSGGGTPTGAGTRTKSPGTTRRQATEPPPDRPPFTHWAYETAHDAFGSVTLAPGAGAPAVYAASAEPAPDDRPDSGMEHSLSAISLPDGTEQWRVALPNPVRPRPLYGGDDGPPRLYVATSRPSLRGRGSTFHAIDPMRGELVWGFDTEERRFLLPLAATDDAVFVGRRDDLLQGRGEAVYALDAADGAERWQVESGDAFPGGSLVRRGTFLLHDAGGLRALEPATGEERWRFAAGGGLDGPAYDNRGERVFVGHEGAVRALALDDGSELWRREFDFTVSVVTSPRQALSDTVFVGDYDGRLLALSPLDGGTRWTVSVDREGFFPSVERTSETLFVGGGSGALALDPVTGETRWSFAPDVDGPLRVSASTTAFASGGHDARVWALDPGTGDERWEFAPGTDIVGPAHAGDLAFVGVEGTVLALDGSHGA